MRRLRILFPAGCFLPDIGGAEVVIHNLAIHLRALGHETYVITWWGNWRKLRGQLPYPVLPLLPRSYTEKGRRRMEQVGSIPAMVGRQLALYQRRCRFDVANIQMANPMGPLATQWLLRSGVPVVVTCQGGELLSAPELRWGARRNPVVDSLLTGVMRECSHITSHSFLMDAEYSGMGVPCERITRIPNGADVSRIQSCTSAGGALRKRYGIPDDAFVCLTVGRNVAVKGYSLIPEIMEKLEHTDRRLWWVLVGAETRQVVERIEVDSIRERVIAVDALGLSSSGSLGQRLAHLPPDEVIQWYREADLYVHPTYLEAFGNVIVEAMAAGLPVVTTERAGAGEYVAKAQCGRIARSGDVGDLVEKIEELVRRPDLRQEMSQRAAAAAEVFDWPVVARQYADVFASVVGK